MTWFRRTGQTWKLAMFALACGMILLRFVHLGMAADLVSSLLGLAMFVWFLGSVRCPYCQRRPVWFMATHGSFVGFDPVGLERCPICRDTGDVLPVKPRLFSSYRRM